LALNRTRKTDSKTTDSAQVLDQQWVRPGIQIAFANIAELT
jgi:hypothetical protein